MKNAEGSISFADAAAEKDAGRREELVRELVSRMTLDEKLKLMVGSASLKALMFYGSETFSSGGCERLGIPRIQFTDGPRGVMLNRSTCFPVSMARGATWDAELEKRVGAAIGAEAREQGANLSGSVCINLLRHPAWGRAQETYGEDTFHVGAMGAAQTAGLSKHVMACVKHFALNSIENARFKVNVKVEDRALMEVYLPHFKNCIDAGAAAVMGAYNRLNGPHCCHSKRLLTDILKTEWGFDGFAISDWTFGVRGSDAAAAGLDIEMPHAVFMGVPLRRKVKNGLVGEEVVDGAAMRIARRLARLEFEREKADCGGKVACPEHAALALEAARKSVVLLKNMNGALPLDRSKIKNIAVIGELAKVKNIGDTSGSSSNHPPYTVTLLEGIMSKRGGANVEYTKGDNIAAVEKAARNADVVIIAAGLTSGDEGEYLIPLVTPGGDRDNLGLSKAQEKMITAASAANRNCVVVLEGGSAITVESWIDGVSAALMAWYPGMEGGNAIAEILFGDVNPSGKLPITFHRSKDQLVPFSSSAKEIEYGYFHGYRHFDRENLAPRFHFGFGLSYTTYKYSKLRINKKVFAPDERIAVKVDISNTGSVDGEEIVQLYAGFPESKVERPVRELKGFTRVALKAGETKSVTIAINAKDLAYYDSASKGWVVEEAEHEIYAGPSSAEYDLKLKGKFRISQRKAAQ